MRLYCYIHFLEDTLIQIPHFFEDNQCSLLHFFEYNSNTYYVVI
jgi:hypothetical protein